MPVATQDSPVTLIEGIGPAIAASLAQIRVFNVFDLLRASDDDLHDAVGDRASLEEVSRWRAMSALLQVEGMTEQWAEALVLAGVHSIEELHQAGFLRWRDALDTAVANGVAPNAPSDEQVAEMRVDVAVLAWSGALNVTVRDAAGAGVNGAEWHVGTRRGLTDGSGRARITRIPLGTRARLIVEKDGYLPRTAEISGLLTDEFQLGVEVVELVADPGAAEATPRFSQFEGDVLPELSTHAMTTDTRDESALREGDVFILRRFYEDGRTAQITSKFLEFEAGRFYAVSFRIARDRLPGDAVEREHFRLRRGVLEHFAMNAARLDVLIAMRRARRAMRVFPPPQTIAEKDAWIHRYLEKVAELRRHP